MEKLIVTILCATCFITFGATFSNAHSQTIEKYVYAQDWSYKIKWKDTTDNFEVNLNTDESLTNLLQICKNDYIKSDFKSHYPYLSWDKFENIKIYKSNLSDSESVAKYEKSTNTIIVNTSIFNNCDNNTKHLCILHELAHCLTSSEYSISCGGFNEPVAELITNSVCESQNIDFNFSYRDVSMIYMIICNCYGFNESIHDFYYGTFIHNLNSITNNHGEDLASILYFMTHSSERENLQFSYDDLLLMAQDIAIHANINTNTSLKDCYNLLVINNDYFTQLISKYN